LVKQICDSEDIRILKGVISKDYVHIHIEYRPSQNISDIVKRLKARISGRLQEEYLELSKHFWGRHFWAIDYGVWSTGNITDKMVQDYLEHHRNPSNEDEEDTITLE
jgi:putative transposase